MSRDELLRRADWRFLAGMPEPRRAYCPDAGALRDAVGAIGTLVEDPAAADCDLAVLRNPGERGLDRARTALAPGGALYVEWWRPIAGGAAAARRRLERAGFEQVACYWPWPPPRRRTPLFWLPIDRREAVAWFLDSRPQPGRRLAAVAVSAERVLWRALWRLGLLAPICAVARKPAMGADGLPEDRDPAGLGSTLPETLAADRESWGMSDSGAVACLLLSGGRSARNKLVALTFGAGEREPQVALKMPRVAEAEAGLEREASVLRAVHADRAHEGIPRLVAEARIGGRIALAETVVSGRPLSEELRPDSHRQLARQVTDFLLDLAAASRRSSAAWRDRIAEAALQAFPPPEQERARWVLSPLGALPEVCEQRDCSPWNLLVRRDGAIAMLDWESAEERGVPALDLLYFLTYAGFFVEGTMHSGVELSSYRRMLTPTTASGAVYAECAATYAERVGIDSSALDRLRLLCWLVHARSAQLRGEDARGSTPQDVTLLLRLAREELARQDEQGEGKGQR